MIYFNIFKLMKKILITGGCGFIGSHLTEYLLNKNYNVVVFDRYNSENSLGNLEQSKYKKDIEFILGDIRDYDSVNRSLKNIDVCFHLAALIGIPYSYISPLAYIKTNIEGTYNILEASRNNDLHKLILTSTSEIYGTAQYEPIDELHPQSAQSPYASSKLAADSLAISYYKSFNLPLKIARPFNVFGPRQSLRAVIPTIISQVLKNKNEIKLGNLITKRDFTYVQDTCEAFYEIMKIKENDGEVFNIGTNSHYSIEEIAIKIMSISNKKLNIKSESLRKRPDKSEVYNLICNNSKLKNISSWNNAVNFDEGLLRTINWFKKHIDQLNDLSFHV